MPDETAAPKSIPLQIAPFWRSWVSAIQRGRARWNERRMLLRLDDRALKDIGLSRCDAEGEAAKKWRR